MIEITSAPSDFIDKIDPRDRKRLGLRTTEEIEHSNTLQDERALQSDIRGLLAQKTPEIFYINPPMHKKSGLPVGAPDFLLCYWSVPLAFECKTGTNKQTDAQYQMQNKMKLNGWKYFVITSLDQVRAILTAIEVSNV